MKARKLLLVALVTAACFLVCHALGLRENVSVLSGTEPAPGPEAVPLGVIYVLAWFAVLLVVPVCVIGAAIQVGMERATARRVGPREG